MQGSVVQPAVLEHNSRNAFAEYTQSLHKNGGRNRE